MIKIHEYGTLHPGTLVKRYKRFLVDVEILDKGIVTAFCPNSGSMKGCSDPGSPVRLSFHSDSPERKTLYTLEMVKADNVWVGVNTLLTNVLAHELLKRKLVRELSDYHIIRREITFGGSRLDFFLSDGKRVCYMEVKNVTLRNGNAAEFPDAVTVRGRKHMNALMNAKEQGYDACMLYVVQRPDCDCFRPAADIDPQYSGALRAAQQKGVTILVYKVRVSPEGICFLEALPLCNRS